jgi:hypothetical protein
MLRPVADEQKPPVAVRITRPYTSDSEFLEREADILTRTSVVLLGAQARPTGVVLRFEIVLKSGESILRGEGRVTGFKEKAHGNEAGLTLRFTRLDSRSKQLVDRAAAMREARLRASGSIMPAAAASSGSALEAPPAPMSSAAMLDVGPDSTAVPTEPKGPAPRVKSGPPPLPESARVPTPAPPSDLETTQVKPMFDRAEHAPAPAPAAPEPPPPPAPEPPAPAPRAPASRAKPPPAKPAKPSAAKAKPAPVRAEPDRAPFAAPGRAVERPADRDALLSRLRTRAEGLPAPRVAEILAKRAR